MKSWPILLVGSIIFVTFTFYTVALVAINWPLADVSLQNTALFGDSFGALNALFTGGAFLLILWTIVLQQKELRLQREEMSRMVATQQRTIHFDLMNLAIHDEELMQVFGSFMLTETKTKRKQFLYVNLLMMMFRTYYEQNLMSNHSIKNYMNTHMQESEVFRAFWQKAREYRQLWVEPEDQKAIEFYQIVEEAYELAVRKKTVQKADDASPSS